MGLDIFKKKKKKVKSPKNVFRRNAPNSSQQYHISSLSERCLNKITNADMPPPHVTLVRPPSTQGLYYCSYPMASLSERR